MSPIKGLTENRQLPRIGKIRLGIKKVSPRNNVEYPAAVDYFVCPPEVQAVYGEKPKALDVVIPVEDEELWAAQYYRQYSRSRGLICKGDGVACRRMIDTKSGAIAGRETVNAIWQEDLECLGQDCPDYKAKLCQEVMNLQFMLPKVAGMGIWQIDTGSIHSIRNINNCATMLRAANPTGRVSWMKLKLTLEPTEVINPDDKKKKTVYCMHLRYEGTLEDLLRDSTKPRLELIIGRPADDEAPEDRLLSTGNQEKTEELSAKAGDDINAFWPGGQVPPPEEDHGRQNKADIIKATGSVKPPQAAQVKQGGQGKPKLAPAATEADKDFDNLESAAQPKILNASQLMEMVKSTPGLQELTTDGVKSQLGIKSFLEVKNFGEAFADLKKLNKVYNNPKEGEQPRTLQADQRLLFDLVKSNMKLRDDGAVASWLENVAKVDMSRVENEPAEVFKEISDKMGW